MRFHERTQNRATVRTSLYQKQLPTFFLLFFLANILYKLTLLLHQQPSPLTVLAL